MSTDCRSGFVVAITLRELLNQNALNLSLVVEGHPASLDAPISWVHSAEYADPTPYLEGGELLLTTGMSLPYEQADEEHRNYAERLAKADVRGLGFGVGVTHAAIPRWLVEQCERSGLPLISVPLSTPFIAISKTISRSLSDTKRQGFARMYHDQQQLLRAIRTLDPVSTIVTKTAELIGGWAALLNPAGKVVNASHQFLPVEVDSLSEALTFSVLGEAKFMVAKGYDMAVFHIASPNGQTLGYMLAGYRGEKGTLNHPLVSEAALLLSLAISSSADANRSLSRLRSSMTRMCLEGEAAAVHEFSPDLWDGLPVQPLAVLRIVGDQEALEGAQRLFEPFRKALAKNLNPVVYGLVDGDVWAVVSQSNAGMWVDQLSRDSRLTVGQSSGAIWRDLPRARHEAYQAAAEALTTGDSFMRYGHGEGAGSLENMVEPSLMRAFADLKLAPIADMTFNLSTGPHGGDASDKGPESADAPVSGDTIIRAIDVLRAWLQSRGRAEAAARSLGMHRHTMTKYINTISKALGVDLTDPGVTAELWFACRFTRFGADA